MKYALAAVVVLTALAAPTHAAAQSFSQSYRDWSITCNNINTCTAYSLSDANTGSGQSSRPAGINEDVLDGWIMITRAAGSNASPRITLSPPDIKAIPNSAVLVLVNEDGSRSIDGQFSVGLGRGDLLEIAPADKEAFLRAARSASYGLFQTSPSGGPSYFVSLSGLTAAGRAMDARQGRTGATNALIDIGPRPSSIARAAPATPVVRAQAFTARPTQAPPTALTRRIASDCGDTAQATEGSGQSYEAFNVGGGRILWSAACESGAYNLTSRLYLQRPNSTISPLEFTSGLGVGDDTDAINGVVNATFAPAQGLMTTFAKSRGLGDCGVSATYAWTGTGFVLASRTVMDVCGGMVSDNWPSDYVSRVVTVRVGR